MEGSYRSLEVEEVFGGFNISAVIVLEVTV
jgi:hypothetical protein